MQMEDYAYDFFNPRVFTCFLKVILQYMKTGVALQRWQS